MKIILYIFCFRFVYSGLVPLLKYELWANILHDHRTFKRDAFGAKKVSMCLENGNPAKRVIIRAQINIEVDSTKCNDLLLVEAKNCPKFFAFVTCETFDGEVLNSSAIVIFHFGDYFFFSGAFRCHKYSTIRYGGSQENHGSIGRNNNNSECNADCQHSNRIEIVLRIVPFEIFAISGYRFASQIIESNRNNAQRLCVCWWGMF